MLNPQSSEENNHGSIRAARSVMDAAREEAKRIIQTAQQQANKILINAEAEISKKSAESTIKTLQNLETVRQHYLLENEKRLIEIALVLGEELAREKIEVSHTSLKARVEQACIKFEPTPIISINLNPADYKRFNGESCLKRFTHKIQSSEHVKQGDALIRTPAGTVELSIKLHLDQIRNTLL